MRITVDIEDDVLAELMKITGDKNKSPAVARAVTEFVRRKQAREFGRRRRWMRRVLTSPIRSHPFTRTKPSWYLWIHPPGLRVSAGMAT